MLSLIIAWLGQDYSPEAEVEDQETLLYCAVSDVMTMLKFSYPIPQMTLNISGVKLSAFKKKLNRLYLIKIIDIL